MAQVGRALLRDGSARRPSLAAQAGGGGLSTLPLVFERLDSSGDGYLQVRSLSSSLSPFALLN